MNPPALQQSLTTKHHLLPSGFKRATNGGPGSEAAGRRPLGQPLPREHGEAQPGPNPSRGHGALRVKPHRAGRLSRAALTVLSSQGSPRRQPLCEACGRRDRTALPGTSRTYRGLTCAARRGAAHVCAPLPSPARARPLRRKWRGSRQKRPSLRVL